MDPAAIGEMPLKTAYQRLLFFQSRLDVCVAPVAIPGSICALHKIESGPRALEKYMSVAQEQQRGAQTKWMQP